MDIQKEREAFEQALVNQKNVSINNLHVCTIFDAEKNKYSPSDVCDPKEDFIVDWINSSWSIWQAAKAQAVPEGFVLVPEGLTHEQAARISDDENFFETYQTILTESDTSEDSAVILIQTAHKAMIEAQEPAND